MIVNIRAKRFLKPSFGAHGARETPVPIPNTEVKPQRAYGTTVIFRGRVGLCQVINQDGRP